MPRKYYLRRDQIMSVVEQSHLSQQGFASELGLSRSHWSQVLNARLAATPRVRYALVTHRLFVGIPEAKLWNVVEEG